MSDDDDFLSDAIAFYHSERRRYGRGYNHLAYGKARWREILKLGSKYGIGAFIALGAMVWYGFAFGVLIALLVGAGIFIYRISTFSGPLKEQLLEEWGKAFLITSGTLIFVSLAILRLTGSFDSAVVPSVIYLLVIICAGRERMLNHPLLWEEAYAFERISDLEEFRDLLAKNREADTTEIEGALNPVSFHGELILDPEMRDGLRKQLGLRIPRHLKKLNLAEAWERRDTEEISVALELIQRRMYQAWGVNIARLDEIVQKRHLAHELAATYLWRAKIVLDELRFDLRTVAAGNGLRASGETQYTIPKSLRYGAIRQYKLAFYSSGSRAMAYATAGQMNPWLAVIAALVGIVGAQVYDSRALRRLKEAEGQLTVLAGSILGDDRLIVTLIQTRFLPDIERLVEAVKQIDLLLPIIGRRYQRKGTPETKDVMALALACAEANHVLEIKEKVEQ